MAVIAQTAFLVYCIGAGAALFVQGVIAVRDALHGRPAADGAKDIADALLWPALFLGLRK